MRFLDPRVDIVFKKVFGSDEHKKVTISFLNSILEYTGKKIITSIEFLNLEQLPFNHDKKRNILDVLCTDQTGARYIVEIQVAHIKEFDKRMVYYGAKTYALQLEKSKSYRELLPVTVVAIIDFVMFPDKKSHKSIHWLLDNKTYEHDLKELAFAFVELPKFTKTEQELTNDEDKWLYFIKNISDQDHIPAPLAHGEFEQACEVAQRMGWSEEELNYYTDELVRATDAQNRLETAIELAVDKALENVARTLLEQGLSVEVIAHSTKLSFEQVEKLSRDRK